MRRLLAFVLATACCAPHASDDYAPIVPGATLAFPADRGSHPATRVEWWYVTGHLDTAKGAMGFQVTFFRLRNRDAEGNPSRFAPTQLLFAHAAISDPRHAKLRHDQRIARAMPRLAEAGERETHVFIDDWSLERRGDAYHAKVPAEGFELDLVLTPTQPALLQGEAGFSRKGPAENQASYYYSEPHLAVTGSIRIGDERIEAKGGAWLDHEWSSQYLARDAVGWDWVGLNLDNGAALMAFRYRDRAGNTVWAGGTLRAPGAKARAFAKDEVRFTPLRNWKSPRTGTTWPIAMVVSVAGEEWRLEPLMEDQELDARASTGTLYWEGAVRATGPGGARARGYLELTGYAEPVRF
jgi:predicted secreted hydrolase